jgi:hypothetical protein
MAYSATLPTLQITVQIQTCVLISRKPGKGNERGFSSPALFWPQAARGQVGGAAELKSRSLRKRCRRKSDALCAVTLSRVEVKLRLGSCARAGKRTMAAITMSTSIRPDPDALFCRATARFRRGWHERSPNRLDGWSDWRFSMTRYVALVDGKLGSHIGGFYETNPNFSTHRYCQKLHPFRCPGPVL